MSNYTEKMIATMKAAAPLNLAKAQDLASDFGVSHRSVISKAKSEGIEYVAATRKAASKPSVPTKADILRWSGSATAVRRTCGGPPYGMPYSVAFS